MAVKHVLIVDDAIDLGRLLKEALRTANPGLPISVVPSAEEAILESTRLTIDLLITDIRLPGMTGLDLVRKIRVRQPNIKVMVITGLAMDPRLQKQLDEINPDSFMHKPMSVPDFLDNAAALLGLDEPETPQAQELAKLATGSLHTKQGKADQKPESPEAQMMKDVLAQALPGLPTEGLVIRQPGSKKSEPQQVEREQTGLSGVLSGLRSSLGARAAILVDESGHTVAQAGDVPDSGFMDQMVPPIMASLSAGARLSYLLGENAGQAVEAYRGKEHDLVCAPVGQFALLVVLKPGKSSLRLALAFEEALNAVSCLAAALEEMGLHVRSVTEVSAPEKLAAAEAPAALQDEKDDLLAQLLESPMGQDPGLEKFEELLSGDGLRVDMDLDSFWASAGEKEELDLNTPGVLSYEQAQKLGLLPGEGEK
jgi:CheY-like chemotaxis protein